MVDVAFVVLDSIAIFLVIVPMPWHVSAWNSATCYMMIWTVLGCIFHLVNSIIWYHNLSNPAPVYCDIATKILIGTSFSIPLSSLCINRRLYNIATMKTVTIGKDQKRRDVILDTLTAVVLPLIFMAVHYTQQGHRYDIVENFGCWATTYLTVPAYILVICPPIVVCSISLVFCSLSIRAFLKRRHDFNALLRSSSSGLNSHRYFRLMALATAEIMIGLPISTYFFATNLKTTGAHPWISWDDTHWHFSRVVYYPTYVIQRRPGLLAAFELDRWSYPFIAFLFFGFFGFADEARANYKRAYNAIRRCFGFEPVSSTTGSSNNSKSLFSKTVAARSRDLSLSKFKEDDLDLPEYATEDVGGGNPSQSFSQFTTMPTLDMSALDKFDQYDLNTPSPTAPAESPVTSSSQDGSSSSTSREVDFNAHSPERMV